MLRDAPTDGNWINCGHLMISLKYFCIATTVQSSKRNSIISTSKYVDLLAMSIWNEISSFFSASRCIPHTRVGRGNLVLRHSVSHFPMVSGGIVCWVAELNAAFCFNTRAKKWKKKIIFHFLEWESNPQPADFKVTLFLV